MQNTIAVEPEVARALALHIRADIRFLHEHQFMDYSLLIGVRRERFRVISHATASALYMRRTSAGENKADLNTSDSRHADDAGQGSEISNGWDNSFFCTPLEPDSLAGQQSAVSSISPWCAG
jgi:hypothetical protein